MLNYRTTQTIKEALNVVRRSPQQELAETVARLLYDPVGTRLLIAVDRPSADEQDLVAEGVIDVINGLARVFIYVPCESQTVKIPQYDPEQEDQDMNVDAGKLYLFTVESEEVVSRVYYNGEELRSLLLAGV